MIIKFQDKKIRRTEPIKVSEFAKEAIESSKFTVIACKYNNEYHSLDFEINESGRLELLDVSSREGMKVYMRTAVYIIGKAFEKVLPNNRLYIEYQLGNAMFCHCKDLEMTTELVRKIKKEMNEIVKKQLPIKKVTMTRKEATKFFDETDTAKGKLQLDLKSNKKIFMYYCEEYYNYCYGTLAHNTKVFDVFDVVKHHDGFLVRCPNEIEPTQIAKFEKTKKLAWALEEYQKIHKVLRMSTVYRVNRAIETGEIKDAIMLAEALHEKKIANIADDIAKKDGIKMILIAGPSSSGKTTFAQRLGIQLRLNGLKPVNISVDNYFVERQDTPRDKNGHYDFENIEAIDLKLFNSHLIKLLKGKEVEMPEFDFVEGTKRYNGKMLKLAENEILVIEGIHCLNDKLTSLIAKENKYKIYISALTVLNMDRYNRISTTDTRLLRRMVRDFQFRGYSAIHTLNTWHKVIEGEQKNIFPYQEQANKIFNTSLIYELNALKPVAMKLLGEIDNSEPQYAEAQRLIDMLKYFKDIPKEYIPRNSLLKEFLGGGDFKY